MTPARDSQRDPLPLAAEILQSDIEAQDAPDEAFPGVDGFLRPDPVRVGTNLSVASVRRLSREEQRELLGDDAEAKETRAGSRAATSPSGLLGTILHALGITDLRAAREAEAGAEGEESDGEAPQQRPGERSPLLASRDEPTTPTHYQAQGLDRRFEAAVASGKIHTTPWREAKMIWGNALGPTLTFVLQRTLFLTSVVYVGHMGKAELAAVSLATMSIYVTAWALATGMCMSLDTLCGQAYGAGNYHLVGLVVQRMVALLWLLDVPICLLWFYAEAPLTLLVEPEIAALTTTYLRVMIFAVPSYTLYEAMRRYLQAQGLFFAATHVLLIAAPLNLFLHWLFIHELHWGFVGSPIAVAITTLVQPLLVILYIRFVAGYKCWGGLSKRAFANWGPMFRLALQSWIMFYAELFAFEILLLAAATFSTAHLAAACIMSNVISVTYQFPLGMAISSSTRIANLIGAGLPNAAKVTARVTVTTGFAIGLISMVLVMVFHNQVGYFFTDDGEVVAICNEAIFVVGAFQALDAMGAQTNAILRGLGMQSVGSYLQLFSYYVVGMPISFTLAFPLHFKFAGLYAGIACALLVVDLTEGWFIFFHRSVWQRAVDAAHARNVSN